jgi:hypothetical protein
MPSEPTVLAPELLDETGEHDYEALHAALCSNARGRAFLAEYARRNRNADTGVVLGALSRLESLVHTRAPPQPNAVRNELRGLLDTIRTARVPVAASVMPEKAARLAALIAELERRITGLVAPAEAEAPAEGLSHDPVRAIRKGLVPAPAEIRPIPLHLAVVPPAQEPELPIPSPAAQPPVIRLVDTVARMPEISWFEGEPAAGQAMAAPVIPPGAVEAEAPAALELPEPAAVETRSEPAGGTAPTGNGAAPALPPVMALDPPAPDVAESAAVRPPGDPLALIMLLSEEERIALFT